MYYYKNINTGLEEASSYPYEEERMIKNNLIYLGNHCHGEQLRDIEVMYDGEWSLLKGMNDLKNDDQFRLLEDGKHLLNNNGEIRIFRAVSDPYIKIINEGKEDQYDIFSIDSEIIV